MSSNNTTLAITLKQLSQGANRSLATKLKNASFSLVRLLHKKSQGEKISETKLTQRQEAFRYILEEAKEKEPNLGQLLPQDTNLAAINIAQALM